MSIWRLITVACTALLLFGITENSFAQPSNYIEQYQEIAIREMHRSGIPASITLAQGIIESSWGNGSLALKANNHFGIKCKKVWTGPTFYIEDDDYKNGKLMKSCFRAYDNAEDSYIDHTDFLMDNTRYQKLFTYHRTEYKKWAHGLKKCGYATDKKYAYKLINVIKKYGLDKYDTAPDQMLAMVVSENAPALAMNVVKQNQNIPQPIPNNPSITKPKAFVLPDNYKRGDGIRKFATKGRKANHPLKNSTTILWNKR